MEIGKTFCGRTHGRTDGRTHLSSNLLGHRRGDDLKMQSSDQWSMHSIQRTTDDYENNSAADTETMHPPVSLQLIKYLK